MREAVSLQDERLQAHSWKRAFQVLTLALQRMRIVQAFILSRVRVVCLGIEDWTGQTLRPALCRLILTEYGSLILTGCCTHACTHTHVSSSL